MSRKPFSVSPRAVGIVGPAEHVSYIYDETMLWRLRSADDVTVVITKDRLLVHESPHEIFRCHRSDIEHEHRVLWL